MMLFVMALSVFVCPHVTPRNVTSTMKAQVFNREHIPVSQRHNYVIDHRLPLELGGTNALSNLYPQTKADGHRKDIEENTLRKAVCSGKMTLKAAQAKMLRDWAK